MSPPDRVWAIFSVFSAEIVLPAASASSAALAKR
jgi:hypothetical protein